MKNTDSNIFHVSVRELSGKQNKTLIKESKIASNIYGLGQPSTAISIELPSIAKHLQEQGDSGLVYLQIGDGAQIPVLIDEVQYNPISGAPIHVSFKRVNMKTRIVSEVELELTGVLDVANATALLTHNSLTVEALPADLPEGIIIDISKLTEIGQGIYVKDLPIDLSKITVLLSDEEIDQPLVIVKEVKEEKEEEVSETLEAEVTAETTGPAESEASEAAEKAE